jgi:hypothetical protein
MYRRFHESHSKAADSPTGMPYFRNLPRIIFTTGFSAK